jgi:hypothetical protein
MLIKIKRIILRVEHPFGILGIDMLSLRDGERRASNVHRVRGTENRTRCG